MDWFKAVLDYIAALQWWQILLGFIAITVLGILIGICAVYLLQRYVYKEKLPFKNVFFFLILGKVPNRIIPIFRIPSTDKILKVTQKAKAITPKYRSLVSNKILQIIPKTGVVATGSKPSSLNKIASAPQQVEVATPSYKVKLANPIMSNTQQTQNQADFIKPKLLVELLHNQNIASESLDGTLTPFQTEVWDTQQFKANDLPTELLNKLERLYTDIKIWNNLVWLATELDHQSHSSKEQHNKLLTGLALRINDAIKKYGIDE